MLNLLLDPNIAYFFLVMGSVLLLFAIVTPGTGILEIGALLCLAVVGYSVFNIGFNLWALIILVLSLVPFIIALRRPQQLWLLALSIAGVIFGSTYLFPGQGFLPGVNPLLALFLSVVAGILIWFITLKSLQAHLSRPLHDLDALLGQVGEAKTSIHQKEGSVQVDGELWTARSDEEILAGDPVRIVERKGFVLIVESDKKPKD